MKKSKIKVILIDPYEEKMTEMEIFPTLKEFYRVMDCSMIESVRSKKFSENNSLYVDEEGTFKAPENIRRFYLKGWGFLIGKALVVNHDEEGKTISTTETVKSLEEFIMFEL